MKTRKFPRSIVASSVPIDSKFPSQEAERGLIIATCRGSSLSTRSPFLKSFQRCICLFFSPITAWHLELLCDLFTPILAFFSSVIAKYSFPSLVSKFLLLPQKAWPSTLTLRFHATQFTPVLKVLLVFLHGILILLCIDHTWSCIITNSTCTPLPFVPEIIKANTNHDLLWGNSQLSIQCSSLCSPSERLFTHRCCPKP